MPTTAREHGKPASLQSADGEPAQGVSRLSQLVTIYYHLSLVCHLAEVSRAAAQLQETSGFSLITQAGKLNAEPSPPRAWGGGYCPMDYTH